MKRILRLMDEGGNYSDSERKGTIGGIVFTEKNGDRWFVYSPSNFIELGRPLKVIRTIEDKVIEEIWVLVIVLSPTHLKTSNLLYFYPKGKSSDLLRC